MVAEVVVRGQMRQHFRVMMTRDGAMVKNRKEDLQFLNMGWGFYVEIVTNCANKKKFIFFHKFLQWNVLVSVNFRLFDLGCLE